MSRQPTYFPAAALLAMFCAVAHGAAEPASSAQARAKLAAVRAQIAALTNRLADELKQRDSLNSRLRESELAITEKRRRLDAVHASQIAVQRKRAELLTQQSRSKDALQAQRSALAEQVRAAYMLGRQQELKLLLNQTSPAGLGRTLAYYGYFAQQRSERIDAVQAQVLQLKQLVDDIDEQSAKLQALESDAVQKIADVQRARADRSSALAALTKQLDSGNRQLGDLQRQEQAVESLVEDLARVIQDFPADPNQSFEHMRGKLPWPVPGHLSARYQAPRGNPEAGARWNGVTIDTARGAKVRAAYYGRVVYADWLQGLGLLLILGHGGGYMTLYGHAEVLYKSVGDWVAPGDVVAALSDADGAATQLYFEIRAGRKTVDPQAWLKASP